MATFNQKLTSVLLALSGTAAAQPVYFQTPDDKCRTLLQTTEIFQFPGNRGFIQDGDKVGCEVKLLPDGRIASLTAARNLKDLKQAKVFHEKVQDAKHDLRVAQAQGKLPTSGLPTRFGTATSGVVSVNKEFGQSQNFFENARQAISAIPKQNFSRLGTAFATTGTHGFQAGLALNNTPLLIEVFYLASPDGREKFHKRQEQAAMEAYKASLKEMPKEQRLTEAREPYTPVERQPVREIRRREDQPGSARYRLEQRREERRAARQLEHAP